MTPDECCQDSPDTMNGPGACERLDLCKCVGDDLLQRAALWRSAFKWRTDRARGQELSWRLGSCGLGTGRVSVWLFSGALT